MIPRARRNWGAARGTGRNVVLCYHSIHPAKGFASATPALFAAHLDWLAEHCDVLPLSQIVERMGRTPGENSGRPAVAITFDDGYADNYEYAMPLLATRDLTATFFLTVGLVEKDPSVVARTQMLRQSGYEAIRPLEWEQVRAMHAAGMEIGAHTWSHPNLAHLNRRAAHDELRSSKEVLEQRLGAPVRSLAYPFGKPKRHFTNVTVAVAAELEYEYACAILFRCVQSRDSKLMIPRFFVTNDSIETLSEKVFGAWDVLGTWQERSPLWAARLVSPEDFKLR
jgi:peptidoglycan/xylan/chitin deacetylase (PgdA/CDA1 family)